jgi:DNA processing protein
MAASPMLPAPVVPRSTLQWLALTVTDGLGPTRSKRLVEHFGGVEGIVRASLTELDAAGLHAASAQSIFTGKSLDLAQQEMVKVAEVKVDFVAFDDPPLVPYVRGSAEALSLPGIAMVATRHPTPYGGNMAERLAYDLSNQGLSIISGLARGEDTAAHGGAWWRDQREGPEIRSDGYGSG